MQLSLQLMRLMVGHMDQVTYLNAQYFTFWEVDI